MYADWASKYPIVSIEDGLAENDWEGWTLLTKTIGNKVELVGDDLFVTNVARIERGIAETRCQRGADQAEPDRVLSETVAAIKMARAAGWGAMVSHRSGETMDTFIADLTVAMDGASENGSPMPWRTRRKVQPTGASKKSWAPRRCMQGAKRFCALSAVLPGVRRRIQGEKASDFYRMDYTARIDRPRDW